MLVTINPSYELKNHKRTPRETGYFHPAIHNAPFITFANDIADTISKLAFPAAVSVNSRFNFPTSPSQFAGIQGQSLLQSLAPRV
jgi:hypothetical protein